MWARSAHRAALIIGGWVLLSVGALLLSPGSSHAGYWVSTGPNTFQNTSLRYQVVVSDAGIFASETGQPVPLQMFNPASLLIKDTRSLFLSYDPTRKRFDRILINGEEYPVRGGLDIRFGMLDIKIDSFNPYASFVVDEPSAAPQDRGVLGILATSVVVNTRGAERIALLEANSGVNQYKAKGLIQTYLSKKEGVFLGEQLVPPGTHLGLQIQDDEKTNPCMAADGVVLSTEDVRRLRALKEKNRGLILLQRLMEQKRAPAFFQSLLILAVDDKNVVGLDVVSARIQIVKLIKLVGKPPRALCVAEDVPV